MLLRMLDAHPQLAVANDTHFIPRVLERARPAAIAESTAGLDIPLGVDLAESIWNYHRFSRLGITRDEFDVCYSRSSTYAEFVSQLYATFAKMRGKTWALEKTPDYVRHIPLLHALFPGSQIIHIIRDGRDVGLSLRDWAHKKKGPGRLALWDENPLATCAIWWDWLVTTGCRDGAALPPSRYFELTYESLLVNPEAQLVALCKFLQLPYDESMTNYHQGKQRHAAGLSAKQAWLPPTQGLRSWRDQLNMDEIELFEDLAGTTLAHCGYEVDRRPPSPANRSIAIECRRWWEAYLQQREEKFQSSIRRSSGGVNSATPVMIPQVSRQSEVTERGSLVPAPVRSDH